MKYLLLVAVIVVLVAPASADYYLTLYFDWYCTGSYGSASAVANSDGTFECDGATGTWEIWNGTVTGKFETGCCPLYVFSLSDLTGRMKCSDATQDCYAEPGCAYLVLDRCNESYPNGIYLVDGSIVE